MEGTRDIEGALNSAMDATMDLRDVSKTAPGAVGDNEPASDELAAFRAQFFGKNGTSSIREHLESLARKQEQDAEMASNGLSPSAPAMEEDQEEDPQQNANQLPIVKWARKDISGGLFDDSNDAEFDEAFGVEVRS